MNRNDWKLRKYRRLTKQILGLEESYRQLSDEELQAKTQEFRVRLKQGAELDSLLVEAYATVREADRRILGMMPYPSQVLGATVLNDRNIAEMATGEGKTLTATMPMYLNGLLGAGAFLVTSNGYLAQRDAEEMGQVYRWLGLTIASGAVEDLEPEEKKEVYQADIVYATYGDLGFDYLFDNLAADKSDKKQGDFRYALIDEVDSVLLDMAQMPLVIAGAPKVQSNSYQIAANIVENLIIDEDYEMSEDQKEVWFTEEGIAKLTDYFGLETLMDEDNEDLYRHLVMALRANNLYTLNRDYVVADDKVVLLDIQDGRKIQGVHLEAGMHQALETKENVTLSPQQRTMASVTYQNLFDMFEKLAGMTGTAATDRREFLDIYDLDVLVIPPNRPNIRQDLPDLLFADTEEKLYASLQVIKDAHAKGQPILIETGSVSLSELYSMMLLQIGIPHNVLNARNATREAEIIKEAGQLNAVTVATSMSGRGTDIKLGPGAAEVGGLLVLGTERMSSLRVDNQLRGRAGRQGDPGITQFYVSLDDRVVIENAPKSIFKKQRALLKQGEIGKRKINQPLTSRKIKKIVGKSQKKSTSGLSGSRKTSVLYDDVQQTQQAFIYQFREKLMEMKLSELLEVVQKITDRAIQRVVKDIGQKDEDILDYVNNVLDNDFIVDDEFMAIISDPVQLAQTLQQIFRQQLDKQLAQLDGDDQKKYFLRINIIHALDNAWIEQVDNLHQLRANTSSRSSANHDPVAVFQMEAVNGFNQMKAMFWDFALANLALSQIIKKPDGSAAVAFP